MTLLLSSWFWLALAVTAAGWATKGWIDEKASFDSFKGGIEALGKQAQDRTRDRIALNKAQKEKADAQNKLLRRSNADLVKRLRDNAPSGSFVPAAPAGSSRPDLVCFDRAEYSRADGEFTEEARGLADEGTAATIDLNTARTWAQEVK